MRAVLVTPLSGPLGLFGRPGAEALRIWAESMPEGLELEVRDFHADPAGALERISEAEVILGPYGAGLARRVAAATERLMWNHGGASSRLRWPEVPNVVNVPAPAAGYFHGVLELLAGAGETGEAIMIHAATGFAREVAEGAAKRGEELGWSVRRIEFPPGSPPEEVPGADLLLVAAGFEDERRLAALLPGRWRRAAFVGAGVEEVLPSERRLRLLGPCQWLPSAAPEPDEGPHPRWLEGVYRDRTGRPPPYPAAQAFAAGLIWGRCAREAGTLEDGPLREAAARLRCRTLFGEFGLDPASGLQAAHRVLTVQWQGGRRRVVWPPDRAQAELR